MGVTLKQIAKFANVSEGTASLAMNHRYGVNSKTKERVLAAAKELGYIANISAQSLSKRKNRLIGVIVPNISNTSYARLVTIIESTLYQNGYKMILATSANIIKNEKEMIDRFVSFRVEGVIIYPAIRKNEKPDYVDILKRNSIPFVFMGGYYPNIEAPHVMTRYEEAVSEVTRYLYHSGCRHFYYMGGCRYIVANRQKFKGIHETLKLFGIKFYAHHYIELKEPTYEEGYSATWQLLRDEKPLSALIASNIYVALGSYAALQEKGVEIPKQTSIVGFDSVLPVGIYSKKISCIEQDTNSIATKTVSTLLSMIESATKTAENIAVDYQFVVRDTC